MLKQEQVEKIQIQLLTRKKQLCGEITSSQNLIDELLKEDANDDLDYAEISSDSHNMNALRNKQIDELRDIDIALNKIENKTYGVCDMCDEEIGIQRLKAKPHARFCVDCRPIYEKQLKEKSSNCN